MLRNLILFAAASLALAAQDSGDKVTVPFRDPSGAKTLKVTLQNGSVTVKGYDGKDALIETSGRMSTRSRRPSSVPEGMHRIDNMSMGLDVTEENNVISVVGNDSSGHVTIQVPVQTSLVLRSVNGGAITVENISGLHRRQSHQRRHLHHERVGIGAGQYDQRQSDRLAEQSFSRTKR